MNFFSLIPQLYFDIISRVIPGLVTLILMALVLDIKIGDIFADIFDGADSVVESALFFILICSALVYLIGHVLESLGSFIEWKIILRLNRKRYTTIPRIINNKEFFPVGLRLFLLAEIQKEYLNSAESGIQLSIEDCRKVVYVWVDWLKLHYADISVTVIKLLSEYRMHRHNSVGLVAVAGIYFAAILLGKNTFNPLVLAALLISALISFRATAIMHEIFQWSVIHHLYALKEKNEQV